MSQTSALKTSFLVAGALVLACLVAGAAWLDLRNDQPQSRAAHHRWEYSVQPATIEDWMTFNYLNVVFKLPSGYLKTALSIQDSRYPDISIRQYAEYIGVDPAAFLAQVQHTLATYPAPNASSTAPNPTP